MLTHYGGKERFGEHVQVQMGRAFVVLLTVVAYLIALRAPEGIFALAIQYAFTGFASLAPLLVAALFWKGSNKWGALASTLWVAFAVTAVAVSLMLSAAERISFHSGRASAGFPERSSAFASWNRAP